MSIVPTLVPLALSRISGLRGDDAKEAALRVLLRAVNEASTPADALADAFERMLSASRAFTERAGRRRAFGDVCQAIAGSPLTLGARRDLLDRALSVALASKDAAERVDAATAALDARLGLRWGERAVEVLEELQQAAASLGDDEAKGAAVLAVATSLAKAGEADRAIDVASMLPASGRRALAFARITLAVAQEGLESEGAALFERALHEIQTAPASPERAQALRALAAHAAEAGTALPRGSALAAALDLADALPPGSREAAVSGAIGALHDTTVEGDALAAALARVDASIERIGDGALRVGLRGRLAVALAALGDVDACVAMLRGVAELTLRLRAEGVTGPALGLSMALPLLEILGELADTSSPDGLACIAASILDLVGTLDDPPGVAALLGEMTRFFASPALQYIARVALLDGALAIAQGIAPDDARVELVANIASALCIAGATERGDALFAGLVGGVGPARARPVRLSRAVVLVRLGRTADARDEIAAAAASTDPFSPAAEELATTMARCGFLADMLAELPRLSPARHLAARAQLADSLVEATYLDPHLREIGLGSLLEGTTGPVRETIACLLDQVRVLEGLGDIEEILARAFTRTAALQDRRAGAIFDRELIDALIERIRCAPQDAEAG